MGAYIWLWRTGKILPPYNGAQAAVAHCVNKYRIRDDGPHGTPALCGSKPSINSTWSDADNPELRRCAQCAKLAKRRGVQAEPV